MRKLLVHEVVRHGGEAGVVFHGKGDRSLPWSDEDDWEFGQGILEGTGRPEGSKDGQVFGLGLREPGQIEESGISFDEGF